MKKVRKEPEKNTRTENNKERESKKGKRRRGVSCPKRREKRIAWRKAAQRRRLEVWKYTKEEGANKKEKWLLPTRGCWRWKRRAKRRVLLSEEGRMSRRCYWFIRWKEKEQWESIRPARPSGGKERPRTDRKEETIRRPGKARANAIDIHYARNVEAVGVACMCAR